MGRRQYFRSKRRGAQLRLLLAVLRRLTAHWWSVPELIADIKVSRRTVWRALEPIRDEGLPLERIREGRRSYYRLGCAMSTPRTAPRISTAWR